MNAGNTLEVATVAGLTLELRFQEDAPRAGEVCAVLYVPKASAKQGATLTERAAVFLCGGRIGPDVHVETRIHRHSPPVLWLRGAAIDLDDATAATIEAWLSSRPLARVEQQAAARLHPRDQAAPFSPAVPA